MSETGNSPSIEDFLTRPTSGPCKYVRATTPEQRAIIREQVDKGVRRFTAFGRWLGACGTEIDGSNIARHFERQHNDEQ